MPEPGWYADPRQTGWLRWWDGRAWTDHTRPEPSVPAAAPPAPAPWAPPSWTPTGGPGAEGETGGSAPDGWRAGPWTAPPLAAPPKRNPWVLIGSIAVAMLLFLGIVVALIAVIGNGGSRSATGSGLDRSSSVDPSPLADRAAAADIPLLGSEGSATHTHTLVLVQVDGRPVTVPAYVGIDDVGHRIAAVHTHDRTGVVHVESPDRNDTYTVGQFLTLWGVGSDEAELCRELATSPCSVQVSVVDPTPADRRIFDGYGAMPDRAEATPRGLDTDLEQGAVILVELTTAAHA